MNELNNLWIFGLIFSICYEIEENWKWYKNGKKDRKFTLDESKHKSADLKII